MQLKLRVLCSTRNRKVVQLSPPESLAWIADGLAEAKLFSLGNLQMPLLALESGFPRVGLLNSTFRFKARCAQSPSAGTILSIQ